VRPFEVFEPRTRFLIGFAVLVAVTTPLLFINYSTGSSEAYREGDVLRATVVAHTDVTGIDISETEKRRNAARENVRSIFNFDSTRGESSAGSFRAAWEDLQRQVDAKKPAKDLIWSGAEGVSAARLTAVVRTDDDVAQIVRLIREVGGKYIYDDIEAERLAQEIVLVDVRNPAGQMIMPAPRTRMLALTAARQELELKLRNLPQWTQDQKSALVAAVLPLIRPNVVLDQTATTTARENEANKIPPVRVSLKRNQVIAREGDTVTPNMLAQLAAVQDTGSAGRPWHHLAGLLFVVVALYRTSQHDLSSVAVEDQSVRARGLGNSGANRSDARGLRAGGQRSQQPEGRAF